MYSNYMVLEETISVSEVFKEELNLIKNDNLREFISICLDNAPKYYLDVAATSSGKHHPDFAQGRGGLVRHVKAAIAMAMELIRCELPSLGTFNQNQTDIIISALLMHDLFKFGMNDEPEGSTNFMHPIYAAEFLAEQFDSYKNKALDLDVLEIGRCIESHMGKFNTDPKGISDVELPKPRFPMEELVHLSDFVSSRKIY